MSIIDPQTGLQALPEDKFWKVEKDTYKFQGHHIYRMVLMGITYREVKRLKWYGKVYTKTLAVHKELHKEPIWNNDSSRSVGYDPGYAPIITPAHLRKASVRTLKEYEEERAKALRLAEQVDNSAELLGEYPPKSIIGKENV